MRVRIHDLYDNATDYEGPAMYYEAEEPKPAAPEKFSLGDLLPFFFIVFVMLAASTPAAIFLVYGG